jgi:glycosyltransferase involved in cell wall biosynthesis
MPSLRRVTRGRPTVFHAIGNLAGAGAQRVVVSLLSAWPREGSRPGLLLGADSGELRDAVPADVVTHVLDGARDLRTMARLRASLQGIAAAHPEAVVVSHMTGMNRAILRATLGFRHFGGISVVEHNNLPVKAQESAAPPLVKRAIRLETALLYRRARAVIGVSAGVSLGVQRHLWLDPKRVHTVLNPIDVVAIRRRMHERPPDPFAVRYSTLPRQVLLAVGRLHDQKNFPALIEAFARLPSAQRGSLVILGKGEREGLLRATAAHCGVAQAVHLPGFVANPWWFMAHADLFVLTSVMEGMPLVLIEALACGLGVVSTDCDHGPREILEAAGHGSLVPVGDIAALAREIERVLAAPPRGRRPGPETERFLATLQPSAVAQRYAELALGTAPHDAR